MKLKRLLMLLLLIGAMMLSACSDGSAGDGAGDGGNDTPPADDGTSEETNYLYSEDIKATLLITDTNAAKKVTDVYNVIKELTGTAPYLYYNDEIENIGHEIVIGESNRSVTRKAYRQLRLAEKTTDYHVAYVIYAEGNSVAIAYDEEFAYYALDQALLYLVNDIIADNKSLDLKSGVIKEYCVSMLDIADEADAEYYEGAWNALYEELGEDNKDLYNALVDYYSIFNGNVATWLANLYDAEIGGFYYSNSARNNVGYAPDIESTGQALGMVSNLAHLHGERYGNVLPKDMKTAIGNYIKSLQDPDGYFYNYQWTKASHGTSRLARDLSSSMSILNHLGLKPTYKTPLGDAGDGRVVPLPDAAVTVWLSRQSSTVTAVSKVTLAAHASYLENNETLLAYLNNLEKNMGGNRFYGIGSNITSQMNQIIARDNELRKAYNSLPADQRTEPYESMVDLVIDWFNERQNPETGHWESTSNYLAVNGILKIMGIYNSAKRAVNYAEEMALAAFDAVTSDEEVTSIVCVYNTWSAILKILNNLRNYAGDVEIDGVMISGKERANKLLATIRESAVEAIAATADKLKIFLKEDGSFSYKPTMSSPTSQGMPVAVTGTNEGDVNATVLATSGTTNSMFTALGLSGFYIQIYGEHELTVFLKTINGLSPVIKDGVAEENEPGVPYGFDDEEIGEAPYGVGTLIREGSTALISSDEKHGKILEVHSAAGVGDYVYVHNDASKNAACYIFEADVNIKKGNGYDVQLTVGSHYMLSMSVSQSKGTVTIAEETHSTGASSVKREIATVNTNEWFNIRVEYYVAGSGDKPMTKVYLNGKLVAVSAAYYGQTVDNKDVKVPSASFEKTTFYIMKTREVIVYLDNVLSTSTSDKYTEPTAQDTGLAFKDSVSSAPATPDAD